MFMENIEKVENVYKMCKFMNPELGNLDPEWVNDVLVPCVVKNHNMHYTDIFHILRQYSPADYDDKFLELAIVSLMVTQLNLPGKGY